MAPAFSLQLLFLTSVLRSTAHQAFLSLRPSSSQVFSWTSISLKCDHEGGADGWSLRRNTSRDSRTVCGADWGRSHASSCSISLTVTWDSGVYWCEFKEGGTSNTINLTVTDEPVILQSPVHPVTEGEDITLSCRTKKSTKNPAVFYKDGSLIRTEPSGRMTITRVSPPAEGFYTCHIAGVGHSPPSWISVKGAPTTTAPLTSSAPPPTAAQPPTSAPPLNKAPSPSIALPPVMLHLQLIFRVLTHLLVFCPFFISTVLLLSIYRHMSTDNS